MTTMTNVSDILLKIVNDSIVGNWEGGNQRGIRYDVGDTSFDTWYSDALNDFLDWYVENYQEDNDEYPPSWVLDVINYEKENYGTTALYDMGNDYRRFHRYINYIKLLEYIYDNDNEDSSEDSEIVGSFKEDMEYVFDTILDNEREDDEEEVAEVAEEAEVDSDDSDDSDEDEEEVAEVDTDSDDSDDSDSDDDEPERDTGHINTYTVSDSDSDSDSD